MRITVTEPIDRAWNRMVLVLFKPFDIGKWFALGLCVFLANLGRSGGFNFNFNFPVGGGTGPAPPAPPGGPSGLPSPGGFPSSGTTPVIPGSQTQTASELSAIIQWIKVHLTTVIVGGAVGILLLMLLWALLLWLRSRGVFMLIDGVAYNRGDIKEPWRNYRERANSLFKFNFLLWLIASVMMLATVVASAVIAWPDIVNETFGERAIWALILSVIVLLLTFANFAIIEMLLVDFIAPTMYVHDLLIKDAWRVWFNDVFRGHFWLLALFYLMKLVLGIGVVIVTYLAFCLTCCLALLPYLGTVILLPTFVFMRCYSLYFLEQFGEPWRIFVTDDDELLCVSCGYDLRGNPDALTCPECGGLTPWADQYTRPNDAT